ncbi:uncharacterized protein CC84DRAFT_1106225, partial [Paraphaeosphaeria sporulosa]
LLNLITLFMLVTFSNKPFSNVLIHYLAILGINMDTHQLRTTKNYLYILTGVIYYI